MARTFTIGELKLRIRRAADFENSNFIGDAELLDYINNSYARLYALLVDLDQDYYATSASFAISTGAGIVYPLPTDMFKIMAVEYQVSAGQFVTLKPFQEVERNNISINTNLPSGTIRLRYVPQPTKYTSDASTVDGIAGWEEFIVMDGAIQCKLKEESDTSGLERRLAKIERDIEEAGNNRDMLWTGVTADVYKSNYPFAIYQTLRYKMYGTNIEFINTEIVSLGNWY